MARPLDRATLAIDGEVKASLAVLETLASSPFLDSADLRSFHKLCTRAMGGHRGACVILSTVLANRSSIPVGRSGRVASKSGASRVGKAMAPDLAQQIARSDSGIGVGRSSEGLSVYHAFTRSPLTGWKTAVAMARTAAFAPLSADMTVLAVGAAIASLIALAAAVAPGLRVSRPISMLQIAIGRRASLQVPSLRNASPNFATGFQRRLTATTTRELAQRRLRD
jgi:hypothetical protein